MDRVTWNRLLPLLVLLLAFAVIVPMVFLVNLRSTFTPSEAFGDVDVPSCARGLIPRYVCIDGNTVEEPLVCEWICVDPSEASAVSTSVPSLMQCPKIDCPLDCITVTEANGCDTCRCDIKGESSFEP